MSSTVKTLLQQINFIETDMELHKQILFTVPAEDTAQIESVVKKIAAFKSQVAQLRQEIKAIDENEYDRIIQIETATLAFRQMAEDKEFSRVLTLNESGRCRLSLMDGTGVDCLVAAMEANGDWSVLTVDGEVKVIEAFRVRNSNM